MSNSKRLEYRDRCIFSLVDRGENSSTIINLRGQVSSYYVQGFGF
jgi:hypothetical protein